MITKLLEDNRKNGFWLSIVILFVGLFFSKYLLSIGIIGSTITGFDFKRIKIFVKENRAACYGLLIFILVPLLSGLWSGNIPEWWHRTQMKFPLIVIPIIFLSNPFLNERNIKRLYFIFIGSIIFGCLLSIGHYMFHFKEIHLAYSQGRVMYVPFDQDHQRFSWAVIGAIWLSLKAWERNWINKTPVICIVLFLAAFIHLLATRTALLSLYLTLIVAAVHLFKSNKKLFLAVTFLIVGLPLLGYVFFTPFKNKIHYVLYDINMFRSHQVVEGLSDGSRMVALNGCKEIISKNLIMGIGFGDIISEVNTWYDTHPVESGHAERLLPPSEYLFYIMAAGILGMLAFPLGLWLIYRGFKKYSNGIAYNSFHLAAFFLLFLETPFEVQRGAIIYSLILSLILLGSHKNEGA
ncbi:MAG: O-antigen ligase family protein [Saprospiraceae bacterium]